MTDWNKDPNKKIREEIRQKALANPVRFGLRGSLSDGINKEKMEALAREYQEKEALRRASNPENSRNQGGNQMGIIGRKWSDEQRNQFRETARRKREERLKAAEIPPSSEMEEKRKRRQGWDREYYKRKKLRNEEKTNRPLPPARSFFPKGQLDDSNLVPGTTAARYTVHCMRCGFPMEIRTAGLIPVEKDRPE
jgi:hypothetical protein